MDKSNEMLMIHESGFEVKSFKLLEMFPLQKALDTHGSLSLTCSLLTCVSMYNVIDYSKYCKLSLKLI